MHKTTDIKGYKFSAAACGLKKNGGLDVGVMFSDEPLGVSAVFTKNKIKAAPVLISKKHSRNIVRALIVNSGNANACTGKAGMKDAMDIVSAVAKEFKIEKESVMICSTGVIGERLNTGLIKGVVSNLSKTAEENKLPNFADSIMTTDTFSKIAEKDFEFNGSKRKIVGVAKGSGMIMPNMATMLGFVFTDLPIKKEIADKMFKECVNASFNAVTVDGDTSTNDTALFFYPYFNETLNGEDYKTVKSALLEVCRELAKMLVLDGEGATKLVKISVINAYTVSGAKEIAFTVANSPLFKTMITGEDLNWGRIMAAVGRAHVPIKADSIDIFIQDKKVVKDSESSGEIDKDLEKTILSPKEINIKIDMKCGKGSFEVLTCNLSKDYIEINGSYRS